ncbi:hypothetical protein BV25DRAFT_1919790 [Artomyces pyxidatus]|uniref:Uncharacterized protein n=1 Tax=Artomyces pyxidatus TaxID=48021 RepID=A0ACB8SN84_9AGAM|nr:hypothetical protein BV25DRAFT_1919790 [Artomyces pyxidatus]
MSGASSTTVIERPDGTLEYWEPTLANIQGAGLDSADTKQIAEITAFVNLRNALNHGREAHEKRLREDEQSRLEIEQDRLEIEQNFKKIEELIARSKKETAAVNAIWDEYDRVRADNRYLTVVLHYIDKAKQEGKEPTKDVLLSLMNEDVVAGQHARRCELERKGDVKAVAYSKDTLY